MTKRNIRALQLLLVLLSLFVAVTAWSVPQRNNYQGKLTDSLGNPLNDTYDMRFSLCDAVSGGTCPWTEDQIVEVTNGIYNVKLGDVVSFPAGLFDTDLYLEVQISDDGGSTWETLNPRQQLTSTGYAIKAEVADGVVDAGITSIMIQDNAVTSTKIADGAALTEILDDAGAGSLLDSDLLDGLDSSEFALSDHRHHALDAADGAPTDALFVDNFGKVGIGTTSPSAKLDVDAGSSGPAATIGSSNTATGDFAIAMGFGTEALQYSSTAMGNQTNATGFGSTAMGYGTTASGQESTVMGSFTTASNYSSTAMGSQTTASGPRSTAMGHETTASGVQSVAMGTSTTASGDYSTAMGHSITVQGDYSFGIGLNDIWPTITQNNTMAIMGGKVGIGATSPLATLQVNGVGASDNFIQNVGSSILIYDTRPQAAGIGGGILFGGTYQSGALSAHAGIRGVKTNSTSGNYSGQLEFFTHNHGDNDWTDGHQRMVITNSGQVGMGTTTPQAGLHLSGSGPAGTIIVERSGKKLGINPNYGDNNQFAHITTAVGSDMGLKLDVNEQNGLTITTGQRVGIGTTTPDDGRLVVANSATDEAYISLDPGGEAPGDYMGIRVSEAGNNTTKLHWGREFTTNSAFVDYVTMDADGNVGVGTTVPMAKLHVSGGDFVVGDGGGIIVSGGGGIDLMSTDGSGPFISLDPDSGTTTTQILEITGGSDLAEPFEIGSVDLTDPGTVVCIDPENPGELDVSRTPYDRRVAGIISGAGGVKPGMVMSQKGSQVNGSTLVALTGRVYCKADASNGPIQPGDLLTTSDTPGHAMKVTDYTRAQGAVIGKAMSPLKQDQGLVLVLVTLQ